MLYLVAIIVAGLGAGGIFLGVKQLKNRIASSASSGMEALLTEMSSVTAETRELLKYKDNYASKGQLDSIAALVEKAQTDLTRERETLRSIETKLGVAQKQVEEKETKQQEIKSAKVEDEVKLQELLARYENLSTEAIALEQKLAASLKNLDSIMDEIELTNDQRGILQELSNALTAAGGRLRDLITEYEQMNQRVEGLSQQHLDLEDEYTKLVEQQLGD